MNLPNKITFSRVLMIPVFMVFLLVPFDWGTIEAFSGEIPVHHFIAAIIFIIASCTDWIDGYYARKLNMVTNLGKFLDPLADKLLVTAALIGLVELQLAPAWMVILILSREFAVTGLRLIAAGDGDVIAASQLGKLKTWIQIIAISALLLHNIPFTMISFPFAELALWAATIITVFSGWDYFMKNKHIMLKSK
ncbi:CDP-diacylglycerol--glycerol-3-phosphate 3-phosphatidyltransferase [Pseudalkalibacillus berkeleyi]|uniref:CDP-diacylglycerol--glycerol-3-phosphate 3-phosphatidyltransferase n=1 Tax=Pseudalkalibacillus berkeleyi TaxID=1069813 RepID=A0ABS9H007_9BACL|nr:CDP-diacylglycerol--glycerol-3-phosphate 3-phosphatidyltransferase [Pseudalkalibacillus berkeleyi]MCF6137178.1 CDP-diacylglycerol--glycerol-3-phosphate 3-phosphatidyltransferase [Pseudalkalibacillus berkeleyi]